MPKELVAQEWLKRWGKGKVQAFQDAFARAFGISLCMVALDGNPLTVWSNSSLFCHYMLQNNRSRCLQERDKAIRQATGTGRPALIRCYTGLTFFFYPVKLRHEVVCFVYGGGFCCEDSDEKQHPYVGKAPCLPKKRLENILALLGEIINLSNPDEPSREDTTQGYQDMPLLQQKLSNREIQIVHLIINGLANKEIAEQLFISEKTVKTHVSNILTKVGVKDRMQLVVFCRQNNIS